MLVDDSNAKEMLEEFRKNPSVDILRNDIQKVCTLYGNRHSGDEIPQDKKMTFKKIKSILVDFVKEHGKKIHYRKKEIIVYCVRGWPNLNVTPKFAYLLVYPTLYLVDKANVRRFVVIRKICYNPEFDELSFKISKTKHFDGKEFIFDNSFIDNILVKHKTGKYYEILNFFNQVLYAHKFDNDALYVHAYGVNGTPDSIVTIK